MAVWKRCSTCKSDIAYGAKYYVCSVSTCRRKRTGLTFCSVDCWEAHVPLMRHREAWAEEETAPTEQEARAQQEVETSNDKPRADRPRRPNRQRRVVGSKPTTTPDGPREVLVVASRLKSFIREVWGMNTSEGVLEPLSEELRRLCVKAVERAREDGRKTVLDRDFDFLTTPRA